MIQFDRVCFSYGARQVLKDLSFSIDLGERVAILGGSGDGKTTILKLIMGLLRPDAGRILIDGDDITEKSEAELRQVRMKFSIVFQEGALFDSLNVKENIAFCLREYTALSEQEIFRHSWTPECKLRRKCGRLSFPWVNGWPLRRWIYLDTENIFCRLLYSCFL